MPEVTTDEGPPQHGSANQDVYLPAALERYLRRPRGEAPASTDPTHMRPRWRASIGAAALFLVVLTLGLLVRVPTGATGTVTFIEDNELAVVMSDDSITETDRKITVLVGERSVTGTVIAVEWHAYIKLPGPMLVVEFPADVEMADFSIGGDVVVEEGTRPILLDLMDSGGL